MGNHAFGNVRILAGIFVRGKLILSANSGSAAQFGKKNQTKGMIQT
jgi:hypothetical protein